MADPTGTGSGDPEPPVWGGFPDVLRFWEDYQALTPDQRKDIWRNLIRQHASQSMGATLREWRERDGKTLVDVEAELGGEAKRSYLSQVEKGQLPPPRLDTIFVLGSLYGIPRWEILAAIDAAGDVLPDIDERLQELDRAFRFVAEQPDFPLKGAGTPFSRLILPEIKLALIRLYERVAGLKVLRDDAGQIPSRPEPTQEGKER